MNDHETLTPDSTRWNEFIERLTGPEGCNFRYKDPADEKSSIWECGGPDKPMSRAILDSMGGVDVPATLEYFGEHHGYCDCEVVFNVATASIGGDDED